MASLVGRLRPRPDRRPFYTVDDSDDDFDFVLNKDLTIELVKGNDKRKAVSRPLTEMEKILDFDLRPMAYNNQELYKQFLVKQYLVKWKGLSYLHCSWVPEQEFKNAYKSIHRLQFRVKHFYYTMESTGHNGDDFVAIPPEWTTVDRIIACRGEDDEKEYLVKYKGLSYDECYWESESDISTFQNEIQRFKDVNSDHRRDKYVDPKRNHQDFKLFDHTPEFITGSLHPYQLDGVNFLRFSWSNRTHVVLADEMGLGKTIQSIAFLASLFEENLAPSLVVAPRSTLRNWEREFATWAPHMNVVMYVGTSKARTVIREHEFYFPNDHKSGISGERKQNIIKFDVILTSYEMINIDRAFLKSIKWKCMIVDEGHRLKNRNSKLFNSLKQFTSEHRVLLTGRPLQNNLEELFVLMHFLDAWKFGSLEEFQEQFKDKDREEQISRLHKMLAPHILRRVMKDVLKDMPPKKEIIVRVDLSSQQKNIYKAIMTRNYKILTKRGAKVSNLLMELRKICLHPYMVEGVEPEFEDKDEALEELMESSGKLQLLDQMMVKLKEQGHRVLIYSQFQHMLNLLEDYCTYKNWFYERIDGRVSGADRQARIDRFNAKKSNRFCFLLSTRVRGVGINLTTADTVIIYDSDWNPHADLQAMVRAHQLGQKEKVMIYRLISRGTVEEKIMQISKKKMIQEHLVVGKLKAPNFSQEELDDIIRYGSKEIFAEENEEAGKFGKIHYDDAAVEKLLDRDHIDAEEENGGFKAFKVANFECIDDNEAAALEDAQAIENKSSPDDSDRASYWEDLLKDKYEVQQAEELNALGKRKRNRKQLIEEYELGLLEASSDDEEDGSTDDEAATPGNQMANWPYRRRTQETSSDDEEYESTDSEAATPGNKMANWPYRRRTQETSYDDEEYESTDGETSTARNQIAKRPYRKMTPETSSDDEEYESTDGEAARAGNQMAKRPYRKMTPETSSDDEEYESTDGEAATPGNQMANWPYRRRTQETSSDDEEYESTDGEADRARNQIAKRPYSRRTQEASSSGEAARQRKNKAIKPYSPEGEGRNFKVLGFTLKQRNDFYNTLMRFGVGNYDWKEFVYPLKHKSYEVIKNYGTLFLKHIVEDNEDINSQTFSDGVPKEGVQCGTVLSRIAVMMLVQEKVKLMDEHPRRPVFPYYIISKFRGLRNGHLGTEEHDKILLRAISKNGVGKWLTILNDNECEIEKLIYKAMNIPYKSWTPPNGSQRDPQGKFGDILRRRFPILEKAIKYEFAEEYYRQGHLPRTEPIDIERALHKFARENISRSLSAIGTDDDVEMKDSEEESSEDVEVDMEEKVIEVVILD